MLETLKALVDYGFWEIAITVLVAVEAVVGILVWRLTKLLYNHEIGKYKKYKAKRIIKKVLDE